MGQKNHKKPKGYALVPQARLMTKRLKKLRKKEHQRMRHMNNPPSERNIALTHLNAERDFRVPGKDDVKGHCLPPFRFDLDGDEGTLVFQKKIDLHGRVLAPVEEDIADARLLKIAEHGAFIKRSPIDSKVVFNPQASLGVLIQEPHDQGVIGKIRPEVPELLVSLERRDQAPCVADDVDHARRLQPLQASGVVLEPGPMGDLRTLELVVLFPKLRDDGFIDGPDPCLVLAFRVLPDVQGVVLP